MKQYMLFFIIAFSPLTSSADATKVIVPLAGRATRLLPLTKAYCKGMIALIDKPALHYIIDEALASDLSDFYFIVNPQENDVIHHYLSLNPALNDFLKINNKSPLLATTNDIINRSNFTYLVQQEPLGLGHAVLQAQTIIGDDSFFCVMLPDNIIESDEPHFARLIELAHHYNASIICVEEIDPEQAYAYGVIKPKEFLTNDLMEIETIIEKPQPSQGTFTLAQLGRYVLSSDIFDILTTLQPGINGEIQLTDAIAQLLAEGKRVLAYKLPAKRHDIGTLQGLLQTTLSLALHNPLYRDNVIDTFNKEMNH